MGEQSARILLVEDSADDAELLIRALKMAGLAHAVHRVRNGVEALAYLQPGETSTAIRPGVVLLDLHMPQLGGIDVLRRLRAYEATRELPVVTMLGSSGLHGKRDSLQVGASATLEKPVRVSELQEVLDQLGVDWRAWLLPE